MKETIDLPADVSAKLQEQGAELARRVLEAIAVDGYRTGALSETQIRRLLDQRRRSRLTLSSSTMRSAAKTPGDGICASPARSACYGWRRSRDWRTFPSCALA